MDTMGALLTAIFQDTRVSRYQNVSILDFIGATCTGDGDGGIGGAIRRAKLQSTYHHQQTNTQLDANNPTNSVKGAEG